jgi:glycosyltransferase involved in cell wall biosynthesis
VAVLLCTFNGADFLAPQLESIGAQQGLPVFLVVSDDGSEDNTLAIVDGYRQRWGNDRLEVRKGPCRGHVANFFSLVCGDGPEAEYFAFADQDDIWDPDKLARATAALAVLPHDQPALYCSRTRLISETGCPLGFSPLFSKPPGFANALVQNIGGGNTMVFNRCARELLRTAGPVDVVSHDWRAYLLVAGAGGKVIYDAHPSVCYRQHGQNLIGSNMSARERIARAWLALGNRKKEWNDRNLDALRQSYSLLSPDSRKVLDDLCRARDAGLIARIAGIRRSGIYAQSLMGNLGLMVATFLKKI